MSEHSFYKYKKVNQLVCRIVLGDIAIFYQSLNSTVRCSISTCSKPIYYSFLLMNETLSQLLCGRLINLSRWRLATFSCLTFETSSAELQTLILSSNHTRQKIQKTSSSIIGSTTPTNWITQNFFSMKTPTLNFEIATLLRRNIKTMKNLSTAEWQRSVPWLNWNILKYYLRDLKLSLIGESMGKWKNWDVRRLFAVVQQQRLRSNFRGYAEFGYII